MESESFNYKEFAHKQTAILQLADKTSGTVHHQPQVLLAPQQKMATRIWGQQQLPEGSSKDDAGRKSDCPCSPIGSIKWPWVNALYPSCSHHQIGRVVGRLLDGWFFITSPKSSLRWAPVASDHPVTVAMVTTAATRLVQELKHINWPLYGDLRTLATLGLWHPILVIQTLLSHSLKQI